MPAVPEVPVIAGWRPRAGSWEEAVLEWQEQVERSFRRHDLARRENGSGADGVVGEADPALVGWQARLVGRRERDK